MDKRRARGQAAEAEAERYLAGLGYVIEERNWRCKTGELDLIALDGSTLVIIEVRSRRGESHYGAAIEAFTPRKCAKVRNTTQVYLSLNGKQRCSVRFDVVAVTFDAEGAVANLKHIAGAF